MCATQAHKMLKCGRCPPGAAVHYRSTECQRAHWPTHKAACEAKAAATDAVGGLLLSVRRGEQTSHICKQGKLAPGFQGQSTA
jgi:hypothetical protein